MSQSDAEQKGASEQVVASATTTRLTGSWLIVARAVWLALVIPSLGLFVVSLPVYYQQLQRGCVDPVTCSRYGTLTAQGLQALSTSGFSVSGYAALLTIYFAIMVAIWCAVGFLLFWRRSDDWLALLAAFFLVMSGITLSNNSVNALAFASPALALPLSLMSFLGNASIVVFFLLFPNGLLVPRWMGLILLLGIINAFVDNLPSPGSSFDTNWPEWLYLLVNLVVAGAVIYSQIYRYRRVSTLVQRQQTKWVVFGVTAVVGVYIGLLVISVLIPSLNNTNLYDEVWSLIFPIALLLLPLSVGFSIMRYRLYDIDVLINRTLVYGTLTVILTGVYVGLIIGLQALLRGLISQDNSVAIVISTLAIAALFQPLRHRLQQVIDRRFYRSKYDAAKIIEAYSATLRSEVDLKQLHGHLVAVVKETMQPTYVSLWVRPPEYDGRQRAAWRATPPVSSEGR
jgi:hypothetical protein